VAGDVPCNFIATGTISVTARNSILDTKSKYFLPINTAVSLKKHQDAREVE
jgi:hypothetical protein